MIEKFPFGLHSIELSRQKGQNNCQNRIKVQITLDYSQEWKNDYYSWDPYNKSQIKVYLKTSRATRLPNHIIYYFSDLCETFHHITLTLIC